MIFDGRLTAARDKNEFLDPGGCRLLNGILNERFVDHRQHFFRHRLGRRQKPRAEAADRKDCLTYRRGHE